MTMSTTAEAIPLLDVRDLTVEFATRRGIVRAVERVNISVGKGETVAIVGESGSGKSVTSQAILGLHKCSSAQVSGEIWFEGKELVRMPETDIRALRGDEMAMIFQDPLSALHPFYTVCVQITEA